MKNHAIQLIQPYGGELVDLLAAVEERESIISRAALLPSYFLQLLARLGGCGRRMPAVRRRK